MKEYQALVADYHDFMCQDPNERVLLGLDEGLDRLPDPSLQRGQRIIEEGRALIARNAGLPREGLSFDDGLDLDLMALSLRRVVDREALTYNGRSNREQLPQAADEISTGIFMLFANDPRPAAERLADITARVEQIPEFVDAMAARLDIPVARWVQMDLDKIAELPELLTNVSSWAQDEAWADAGRLQAAVMTAGAALQQYGQELRQMGTTEQFAIGRAAAEEVVANEGITLSLEDIHQLATDFLAETGDQIAELHGRLCDKHRFGRDTTVAELQELLARKFAAAPDGPLDAILTEYQAERERVLAFVTERDLFPIPDQQELQILQTPGFLAPSIPAGAMQPPAPFRDGVRTSLVYLTLSEELRAEHTRLGIPSMMVHEGIPGHHLQLATASMHASVVRRHFQSSHHAEGWTTMLEDYMLDQGYAGELTDEARFVTKRELSRLGARAPIDLFFMTGERAFLDVGVEADISPADPFEAAGNLLASVTGFVPGRVQAELNWYSQERGYPLSYLVGNALVWQLKRDFLAAQGTSGPTVDREFHRLYLESGNMPVATLRGVFEHQGLLAA